MERVKPPPLPPRWGAQCSPPGLHPQSDPVVVCIPSLTSQQQPVLHHGTPALPQHHGAGCGSGRSHGGQARPALGCRSSPRCRRVRSCTGPLGTPGTAKAPAPAPGHAGTALRTHAGPRHARPAQKLLREAAAPVINGYLGPHGWGGGGGKGVAGARSSASPCPC